MLKNIRGKKGTVLIPSLVVGCIVLLTKNIRQIVALGLMNIRTFHNIVLTHKSAARISKVAR